MRRWGRIATITYPHVLAHNTGRGSAESGPFSKRSQSGDTLFSVVHCGSTANQPAAEPSVPAPATFVAFINAFHSPYHTRYISL